MSVKCNQKSDHLEILHLLLPSCKISRVRLLEVKFSFSLHRTVEFMKRSVVLPGEKISSHKSYILQDHTCLSPRPTLHMQLEKHHMTNDMGLHIVPQPGPRLGIIFGPSRTCYSRFLFFHILEFFFGDEKGCYRWAWRDNSWSMIALWR